jgi:hypothetical protein
MRVTAKMPVLYGVRMGEKVPFDFCFELTSTDINVEIRYNDMVLTQGVTKNRSIIRNKFIVKASPSDRLEPGRRWWPNEGLKKKTSHFFLRKNL